MMEDTPLEVRMAPCVLVDLPTKNNAVTFIPDVDELARRLPDAYKIEGPLVNGVIAIRFYDEVLEESTAEALLSRVEIAVRASG